MKKVPTGQDKKSVERERSHLHAMQDTHAVLDASVDFVC